MGCAPSKAQDGKANDVDDSSKAQHEQKKKEDPAEEAPPAAASPAPRSAAAMEASARRKKIERTTRTDIGARKRPERKYKLEGPAEGFDDEDGWTFESVIDGGLLYKLTKPVATGGSEEAYYNDSADFQMNVNFAFGPESAIECLDETVSGVADEDSWKTAALIVYPGETKRFVTGTPNGHRGSYNPEALSDEYHAKILAAAMAKVASEQSAIAALGIAGKSDAEVLELCAAKGVMFVDPCFPPCRASLQRPDIDAEPIEDSAWRRPTDYLNAEERNTITLINGVEPDDIDQGSIGDCWFLCSVASLAEFPDKITDIFKHPVSEAAQKAENKVGGYRVTFMKGGWWREVIVDDYFPTAAGLPRFSKNVQDRSELWVAILEKAYAKIHGSYSSIVGGDPLFAMQDLSGYPITRFDTEWTEALESREGSNKLFAQMERYDQAGYMLSLSTPGNDASDYNPGASANDATVEGKYKKAGLALGHAYSVLTVKSFPDKHFNLLRIRNPWGNATEWTGAWHDEDPRWTEHADVAKGCAFEAASDGTFWMEWEDVKEFFDGGGCCFTCFDWHDYRMRGSLTGGKASFVVEITVEDEDLEAFIVASQEDTRGRTGADAKYEGVLVSIAEPADEAGSYTAVRHGCSDADSVATDFTFLRARDVAMKHTFKARKEPYVILIREYSAAVEKPIGVGLIAERAVGDGYSVRMVAPPAACKYYENFPTFEYAPGTSTPVTIPWQYNPEVGTPVTYSGSELKH